MTLWSRIRNHLSLPRTISTLYPYIFGVYALAGILISFLIELSPLFQSEEYWETYSIYGVSMLSISIVFYALLGITSTGRLQFLSEETPITGVGESIFFLRLGAAAFSIFAIVLWSIELFLAFANEVRPPICIIRTCLYIVFHVCQLVFVIKSSHLVFHCHRLIVYFGLTHSLVVNIWTWVSLCIAKSGIPHDGDEKHVLDFGFWNDTDAVVPFVLHPTEPPRLVNTTFERHEKKLRVVNLFGETAITLLTGNVEFCLISAGILLSFFITLKLNQPQNPPERETYIGFDYDNTAIGITLGIIMLIFTCLDIAINSILRQSTYHFEAGSVSGTFQICFYLIAIATCLITYHCLLNQALRNLEARNHQGLSHQTAINVIFLLIGVGGEVAFCSVGILGVIEGSSFPDSPSLALASFIVRLIDVGIQGVLLLYLLDKCHSIQPHDTVGKQAITFLVALNVILFGFHTLESTVQSFGFPTKIDETHLVILKIAIPLVVFYRFHCAVCFAEVWKVFYNMNSMRVIVPPPIATPRAVAPETPGSGRFLLTPDPPESREGYEQPDGRWRERL